MLLLVALLMLATIVPASAQVPADVPADHWAVQAIGDLYSRGIFVGYPDDTFRGDRAVTRYELAVVLSRLLESLPESADLSKYVTKTELQTKLNSYPTKTELQNTLKGYPTKAELQTALNSYVTKAEFERRLANLATKDDIAKLQKLVDNLRTELTALGVRVDDVQKKLTALEARVGNLETRVTKLENRPQPEEVVTFSIKGGVAARSVSLTKEGVNPVNEYDRSLDEGFNAGAAFDASIGFNLSNNLGLGARIFTTNDNLSKAALSNLDSFNTDLGLFVVSGANRLDLGIFNAFFTPFTLANSSQSILEQLPAFGNDWYFSGAKLAADLGAFRTTALFSRTRDEIFEAATDMTTQYPQTLFAARTTISPISMLDLGATYVRVNDEPRTGLVDGTALGQIKNRVWSIDAGINVGPFDFKAEYADSSFDSSFLGSANGMAYKLGAAAGPVDAYYLQIGSVTNPFVSYYGDPSSATMFNAHGPSLGAFLTRFTFGQVPNPANDLQKDLNNNIRGYGALVSLGNVKADFLNPVSAVFKGTEAAPLRVALGYERLSQVEDLGLGASDGIFKTYLVDAAFDLSGSFTLLGSFKNRKVNFDDTGFAVRMSQDMASLGVAYKLNADNYLALQHVMIDYSENLDSDVNSQSSITKATLNVKF